MSTTRKLSKVKSLDFNYDCPPSPTIDEKVYNVEDIRSTTLKYGFIHEAWPKVRKLSYEEVSKVAEILNFSY